MNVEDLESKYISMYNALKQIIATSQQRVIAESPDELFLNNINFFAKAYLINICTYLESYLKETAIERARKINDKIVRAGIPHNYVHWQLSTLKTKDDYSFSHLTLPIDNDALSTDLSANVYKTIELFKHLGIDLTIEEEFQNNKGKISALVTKRNKIIHHNDNASDLTFPDLIDHIDVFINYLRAINKVVKQY